jgi:glycosyltransferase involved in cell wall biosynthesis
MFPDWVSDASRDDHAGELAERERDEWTEADIILCASEFVRDGISRMGGPIERCVVLPYGVDVKPVLEPKESHTGPLRVLTVGTVGLRKGSHYVFDVACKLEGAAEFRMVGPLTAPQSMLGNRPGNLELVGAVPRSEITAHYRWADVFLLPSLCEGSATVTYEALGLGLPVVCTPNTGSVVRDGIDGFIVDARDSPAIVKRLLELRADPELRNRMSEVARDRGADFSLDQYGRRLNEVLCAATGRMN